VPAKDVDRMGVESRNARSLTANPTYQSPDALQHLIGGFIGESDRQDTRRLNPMPDERRYAVGYHARFPRTRSSQY
jgi:hypothetical protein